jgi:hypothetical protein
MSLDVDVPDPPRLEPGVDASEYDDAEVAGGTDYRRDELDGFLQDGAWADAWAEWAAHTELDAEEFAVARELGLFEQFDFFWDGFAERVGYHAPGIPEDWKARELHPAIDSWSTVSAINAGLTELGQVVCDVLKDEYVDWESDYEPPEDLPDFGE